MVVILNNILILIFSAWLSYDTVSSVEVTRYWQL